VVAIPCSVDLAVSYINHAVETVTGSRGPAHHGKVKQSIFPNTASNSFVHPSSKDNAFADAMVGNRMKGSEPCSGKSAGWLGLDIDPGIEVMVYLIPAQLQ
jgi:hypothetical protein